MNNWNLGKGGEEGIFDFRCELLQACWDVKTVLYMFYRL